MGTLHDVTQLRPFVLSGDGAFLPILSGCETKLEKILGEHTENENRLLQVPAGIQHADAGLTIHGMHTTTRNFPTQHTGAFLYIEPGGKHGYGSILSSLVEHAVEYLDDFWFLVLWNNNRADEYVHAVGNLKVSESMSIPTSNYEDFVTDRLKNAPDLLHRYLLESALWAKRWYEADGSDETGVIAESFPDAIRILKKAMKLLPNDPSTMASLEWYNRPLPQSDG